MRDEQHGDLALAQFLELAHAAVGEHRIAHRQGFVDDQNLGVHVNGRGECQPHVHAARIFLDGARDELADFRERFDRRHGALDFAAAQAHDFAIQEDVFAAGEFGVEARAQFEQRGDAPARHHPSLGGRQDAATICSSVLLPDPFGPTSASVSPFSTWKPISRSAQKSLWKGRWTNGSASRKRSDGATVKLVKLGYVLEQDHWYYSTRAKRGTSPLFGFRGGRRFLGEMTRQASLFRSSCCPKTSIRRLGVRRFRI